MIGDVSDASRARSRLVLYTKPGCCLCEGLEEKLGEIFRGGAGAALGDALRALEFETRDVSTNETWARKHASEVPVLSLVRANAVENGRGSSSPGEPAGETETETFLPRPAPRLSAARLATRLGQDVGVALRGDASARKGWATGQAVDAAPVEPSGGKGGRWSRRSPSSAEISVCENAHCHLTLPRSAFESTCRRPLLSEAPLL